MAKQITPKVSWVGKVDWELTRFHGDEYSTHRGSSYNSYLVRDQKTLIDTVWQPYDREFVSRLKQEIDLKEIDYIVMQHNEIDHSGALPELMREIPDTPIYCTKKGEAIIRGHYHADWNFVNVKTGDTLSLGDTTLTFIEATMLHWPDTMFTYMDQDGDPVLQRRLRPALRHRVAVQRHRGAGGTDVRGREVLCQHPQPLQPDGDEEDSADISI